MPQLSPMSWVFIFMTFFSLFIMVYISIWWMVGSSYKLVPLKVVNSKIGSVKTSWEWSSLKKD